MFYDFVWWWSFPGLLTSFSPSQKNSRSFIKANWQVFTCRCLNAQVTLLFWISFFFSCLVENKTKKKKKNRLNLVGLNKGKNVVKEGRFLLFWSGKQRPCGEWLKVPEGIWSLLVFTSNAVVPMDSLYCCQLNGIMSVWKVFENEPKIIFTSGWLLLPHVNRTLSEWPRFLSLH